jgi:hypothetical protein
MGVNMKTFLFIFILLLVITSASATDYYYSQSGDDSKDCSTPALACKTINDLNGKSLVGGDNVYFKRGDTWRILYETSISDKNGSTSGNVTYTAYGSGAKPKFTRAINDSTWTDTGGNIWKSDTTINDDIGLILFNGETSIGYKQGTLAAVTTQGYFFYNSTDDKVYLYSTSNPSTYYSEIQLSKKGNIFDLYPSAHHIVIKDLDLRYSAKDAIYIGMGADYIYIINNSISWIGGAYQSGTLRYGNCIEVVGGTGNSTYIYVTNNTLNQCYDAGTSWQSDNAADFRYMYFTGNVIANTRYCYEIFNHNESAISKDLVFDHNTCYYSTSHFGSQTAKYGVRTGAQRGSLTQGINITNNIFYESKTAGILLDSVFPVDNLTINYNKYYQDSDTDVLISWKGTDYHYTSADFATYQTAKSQDANSAIGNPEFTDSSTLNFIPLYNSTVCTMSSTSSYVGALPCADAPSTPSINIIFKIGNLKLRIGNTRLRI